MDTSIYLVEASFQINDKNNNTIKILFNDKEIELPINKKQKQLVKVKITSDGNAEIHTQKINKLQSEKNKNEKEIDKWFSEFDEDKKKEVKDIVQNHYVHKCINNLEKNEIDAWFSNLDHTQKKNIKKYIDAHYFSYINDWFLNHDMETKRSIKTFYENFYDSELNKWFRSLSSVMQADVKKNYNVISDNAWFFQLSPVEKIRLQNFAEMHYERFYQYLLKNESERMKELGNLFTYVNNITVSNYNKVQAVKKYETALSKNLADVNEWNSAKKNYLDHINSAQDSTNIDNAHVEKIFSRYKHNISRRLENYYEEISKLSKTNDDYRKRMTWLKLIADLPTEYKKIDYGTSIKSFLFEVRKNIDNEMYGMDDIKEEIMSIMKSYLTNPGSMNNTLALEGSPGIGKTDLIRKIAKNIGLPFLQISVSNTVDSLYLTGCGYSYSGSEPGILAKGIIQMGYKNGIIFFDEIDKIMDSNKGQEIFGALMQVCDFSQNHSWEDKYFDGIPIDLSGYLFVYSLNDPNKVQSALFSRISQNMFHLEDYIKEEKVEIILKYTIPNYLENLKINKNNISIEKKIIEFIVEKHEECGGMREINGTILRLLRLIDYYNCLEESDYKYPLSVSEEMVTKLLFKKSNYYIRKRKIMSYYS